MPENPTTTDALSAPASANLRVRIGRFLFTYRNLIFPAFTLAMLVFMRPVLFRGEARYDWMLDLAGFGIACAGQILRAVVIGLAYIKRGGKDRKIAAPVLVRQGVFSLSRNPLYLGNMAIVLGLVIIYHSPWAYAIVLPGFFFAYVCIVEAEEEFLRRKFGPEFDGYCASVNRFFPTPRKSHWVFEGGRFDVRRVIRKDYSSAFSWFTIALVLMAWEGVWNFGLDASRGRIQVLGAIWLAGLIAAIIARILKKKKYLASPD